MRPRMVTLPELALIAGTRMALGAGIGLLAAEKLDGEQRRAIGWTLLAVGAISTFPLVAEVFFAHEGEEEAWSREELPQSERWQGQEAPGGM